MIIKVVIKKRLFCTKWVLFLRVKCHPETVENLSLPYFIIPELTKGVASMRNRSGGLLRAPAYRNIERFCDTWAFLGHFSSPLPLRPARKRVHTLVLFTVLQWYRFSLLLVDFIYLSFGVWDDFTAQASKPVYCKSLICLGYECGCGNQG